MMQRQWEKSNSAVFHTVRGAWGAFSNFHPSPLTVEGVRFQTAEALYQAMRYVLWPDIQRKIVEAPTAKEAKIIARSYLPKSRDDWQAVKVDMMRWVLRVKAQQWPTFPHVLGTTGHMAIVELSYRDSYWGARPRGDKTLVGVNMLGQLMMELRAEMSPELLKAIETPSVGYHPTLLLGRPIGVTQVPQATLF